MVEPFELHVHFLCPYAQRALYVAAFKEITCCLVEEDLSFDSPSLLAINPLGKVPAIRVVESGVAYNIYESIEVCEYLDSFPGPSLYPDSSQNSLVKPLINSKIRGEISEFVSAFVPFWWKTPSDTDKQIAVERFRVINERLRNGGFYMQGELGNVLTMADVMLYPFIERVWALKESYLSEMTVGLNLKWTWEWYRKMSQYDWIQRYKAGDLRLRNVIGKIKRNEYSGLTLPITVYDS